MSGETAGGYGMVLPCETELTWEVRRSYTVKKRFAVFPSPAGMSPTKLSLAGNN
jgi:hypothetical protein